MSYILKRISLILICVSFLTQAALAGQTREEWIKVYFNMPADHSVALPGNESNSGRDLIGTLRELIDSASTSIDVCIYDLEHPRITEALVLARERGLRVRVVTDNQNRFDGGTLDKATWAAFKKAGIISIDDDGDVYESDGSISDHDLTNDGAEMHHKFAVIDAMSPSAEDDYVWTGSTNLTYTGVYNTNNAIVIKDAEVAGGYLEEFEQMWGDDDETPDPARALFHKDKKDVSRHVFDVNGIEVEVYFSPLNRDQSKPSAGNRIAEVIRQEAQHDINFQAFAITPDIPLSLEMWNRSSGGIQLNGVIDPRFYSRYESTGEIWASLSARTENRMILPASELRLLHHKVIVLDGANPDPADQGVVITGSYNFSNNAEYNNDENVLIIYSDEIANQYYQDFMGVMSRAKGESYPPAPPFEAGKWYEVYSVTDGSRFEIEVVPGFGYGVRLLGVEVPAIYAGKDSSDYFSGPAAAYLKNLLEGRRVRLLGYDGGTPEARYNAFQAYVEIDYEGKPASLNKIMLEKGYGRYSVYHKQNDDSVKVFKGYEMKARNKEEGMWKHPRKAGTKSLRTEEVEEGRALNVIYPININTADGATLQLLPGIGPVYAKRIIEYRQQNGGFNSVQEITNIKGIGPKTLQKLRPIIIVE